MLSRLQRLKPSLMTSGIAISPEAMEPLTDHGARPATLADYPSTSGVSLELEDDIWVNAPIKEHNPNFVGDTPYRLEYDRGGFLLRFNGSTFRARPVPVPAYHDRKASSGEPYTHYGITHTDRVRISPVEGCAFACRFCDMSFRYQYRRKPLDVLIETIRVALGDPVLPAKHILISGGTPREGDYPYLADVYARVAEAFSGIDVDVMVAPLPGFLRPKALYDCGIHGLSVNLELFNESVARDLMPQKASIPQASWLRFIEEAVSVFGPGRVRSLLMLGLEPVADTVRGVEALAERGCEPVLSPFRPSPFTPLRDRRPPCVDSQIEAYERSVGAARRHGRKLGPRCIPCQHNTLSFPDGSDYYFRY